MKFSMLLINNNRSKAYLQNLIKNRFFPTKIIILNDEGVVLPEHTENDKIKNSSQKFVRRLDELDIEFDEKEHILTTIKNNNIDYVIINNLDINSKDVIDEVKKIEDEYILYSGPGGSILRKEILSYKKFIHIHPGYLPTFRGSTTIYYSKLIDGDFGASVILFEEGIDEGPILYRKKYHIKNIDDYDYLLDPLIRAKTLIEFFKQNKINPIKQSDETYTFYIIHPFLKHLARQKDETVFKS